MIQKEKIFKATFSAILGQEKVKAQVKSALLARRHMILLGPPGIGKTTLARCIAELLDTVEVPENVFDPKSKRVQLTGPQRFIRVQGSPDLTAEDLLGDIDPLKALQFGPTSTQAFTPGKIFRARQGVLFFDEVNRASEKLQNALLQVLQEGVVTLGSYDVPCPVDFIFIGTMNPEDASTEQLSDVFMDRFDVITMEYPASIEEEHAIVTQYGTSHAPFPADLLDLTIRFVRSLREHKQVERKPSVRATIGLYERASADAALRHAAQTELRDVIAAIPSVLAHRLTLKPSIKYLATPEQFVEEEFRKFTEGPRRGGAG